MKIGFIGAGGTGKTTILDLLPDNYKKIRSVMRETFAEMGWTEKDLPSKTPAEVWKFQKLCFDKKILQDQKETEGVAERTLLDHLMYCIYYCSDQMDDNVVTAMMLLTRENMATYDVLFYFPAGIFQPDDDGLRRQGRAYQHLQDAIIIGLIKKLGVDVAIVTGKSVESRMSFITRIMEDAVDGRHLMKEG